MAKVQPVIKCEIDPMKPVPEICAVIMAVTPYHPQQEDAILLGVQEAIQKRRDQLAKQTTRKEEQQNG
ncbi:hypothetical protein DFQ01_12174 [Paenibacillus cellulosilyticus]|uniref:Uncharacterized protein n=1 Tax=Paenibacillus cellulosilyticus TaxID=375489 RepID=A0A2V2YNN9_9BACL|nr:hypothetical protein [Paenibacillus cellulosilyticus]PWV97430.1 hypothetical protein DFQ01_12174 [Paenibacillus cellulosilyticus]QKS48531.1 hypothetical protein HUB94_30315 [Paenibacillus cellulosilyticus]